MVCLKALALSIATISALIATGTLASPVERQLRRFDVSADCATHQAGAERIPCSGTPEHGKAAARDVQLTDLAHLLGPKQGPHSQQLDPMPDKDPGVHHLMARELEVATTEETLAEPRTIEARSHVDSFDAERRDERRTARGIHPPRHSKRVDLFMSCYGDIPTSRLALPVPFTPADYGQSMQQYCSSSPGPACSCQRSGLDRRYRVVCNTNGPNARWQMALATTMCRTDACMCSAFVKTPLMRIAESGEEAAMERIGASRIKGVS